MARRKRRHEKEPNHERWLVSYADFITLLFAFFVTMYSISRVDSKKFGSAVDSIHHALGSVVPVNMPLGQSGFFSDKGEPIMGASVKDLEMVDNQLALTRLLKNVQPQTGVAAVKGLRVTIDERGLVVSFPDTALFEACSANIRPENKPLLDAVGEVLLRIGSPVRVEGHTDIGSCSQWPSNWELSTARACAVVRHLTSRFNFNPARLSAAGFAGFRPRDTNDTESGRASNRRVDIVILSGTVKAKEPQALQPPPVTTELRK
jgi:chemotaxis protein MotB